MIENNNFDRVEDIQQQDLQVDYPQIDNFLKNWFSDDIKIIIDNVFNDNPDLKDSFESFLKQSSLKEKMVCKQHLKEAKNQEEIKNIIFEQVPWWYRISWNVSEFENVEKEVEYNSEEEQGNNQQIDDTINKNKESETVKNIVASMADAKEKLYNLLKDNYSLQNDVSEWSEKYNKNEEELEKKWVLKQLRWLWLGEKFVSDYIQIYTAIDLINYYDEYKSLRGSQDFSLLYIAMKNLNNACNIPDTTLNSFSKNNIKNTRSELFHETIWNKWLIRQRAKNIENHKSDYEKLFYVENDNELIQKYWRFLDWVWKNLMEKRLQNPASLSVQENDDLMNGIISKKQEIEYKTKNMVEELCMTSQVKWFLACIPKEYSSQFTFNKANEISFNQDGVLQLDWHIKWVNFSLRQDTNDVNARFQTSTMLSKDQDHNLNFTWRYRNSPFILPTTSQVFDTALSSVKDDSLSEIGNQKDYFEILETSILENIGKLYENTDYAHHYVKSQIKSEEIVHETMQIFNLIWWWNIENLSNISNEKLYKFFDTIEFNLSVMTNKEKDKFNQCLWILWKKIAEWWNIQWSDKFVKDEGLANLLGSKKSSMKILWWMWWCENELSFFDVFSLFLCQDERNESWNRKMINLYELYNAINGNVWWYAIAMWRCEDRYKSTMADNYLTDLTEQLPMC